MQINSIKNDTMTNFQAKVSPNFINAAKTYYTKNNSYSQCEAKINRFMSKVGEYAKYGSDDINVVFEKVPTKDKQYALYAVKDGMKPGDYAVLTVKDQFRKVLEKFLRINRYEFEVKTKDIK